MPRPQRFIYRQNEKDKEGHMIHYLKGRFAMQTENGIVIDVGGIGYEVAVPASSPVYSCTEGQSVMLYTYMAVREDDVSLYGFTDTEGLSLFKKLLSVSGIGAKGAMSILSAMSADDCRRAIAFEDADMLTRANGIGKKTAQRIVLELKDKVNAPLSGVNPVTGEILENTDGGNGNAKGEALNALVALGYSRSEALSALASVPDTDLTSEEYIKKALKQLF